MSPCYKMKLYSYKMKSYKMKTILSSLPSFPLLQSDSFMYLFRKKNVYVTEILKYFYYIEMQS